MTVKVVAVESQSDFAICMAIRMEVFIREQAVTLEEEMDGKDNEASHYLVFVDGKPAATARMRIENGIAKMERVAVRVPFRRTGIGRVLMERMIADAKKNSKLKEAKLGAQRQAIPFYESLGFEAYGEEYTDARIPHRLMKRELAD